MRKIVQQPAVNLVMRQKALELGAKLIVGHKVLSVNQDKDSVTVQVEDYGEITGKYLIACDGGSSIIRKQLGFNVSGPGPVQANML